MRQSSRFGAPITPLLSDLRQDVFVDHGIEALFDGNVLDGTTLRSDAFVGTHDTGMFLFAAIFGPDASGSLASWYSLDANGSGTETLTSQ